MYYLLLEYLEVADTMAGFVEKVLEIDHAAKLRSILWYSVELYSGDPWTAKLQLASQGLEAGEVLIKYENEEIHCHACLSFNHSETCSVG
jgi:hypothetical protein